MVKGPTELAFLVEAIVYEVVMTFSFRLNTASIQQHSGFICLDFDNETRDNILRAGGEYIYACFLSPSGKGYKVLVRIPPSIEDHTNYFLSLKDHFNLPSFDIKVKNISTACYDTEDPDIYINPDAPVYLKMNYTESFKSFTQIPAGLLMTNSSRSTTLSRRSCRTKA